MIPLATESIHPQKKSWRKENLLDMMQNEEVPHRVTEKDMLVIKPNFWTFGGNGYLQFSQNYISKNCLG